MSDKLMIWIKGSIKLNFDQQLEVTKEEYDHLMNENTCWSGISEIDRNGKFNETYDIIMNQLDLDDGYTEEINIDDIELEEND